MLVVILRWWLKNLRRYDSSKLRIWKRYKTSFCRAGHIIVMHQYHFLLADPILIYFILKLIDTWLILILCYRGIIYIKQSIFTAVSSWPLHYHHLKLYYRISAYLFVQTTDICVRLTLSFCELPPLNAIKWHHNIIYYGIKCSHYNRYPSDATKNGRYRYKYLVSLCIPNIICIAI